MLFSEVLVALLGSLIDGHAVPGALPTYALLALATGDSVAAVNPLNEHFTGDVGADANVLRLHELLEEGHGAFLGLLACESLVHLQLGNITGTLHLAQ